MMNLRAANERDLSGVISWIPDANECKLWAGPCVRFPLSIDSLKDRISFTAENSFCIEERDEVVAFGQLVRKSKQSLHLARIIVDPSKRGKGYGRMLCRGLIEKAIGQNCHRITLNVYRHNTAAMNLYKRIGFEESEPPVEDKPSKDNCFMVFQPKKI